MTVSNKLMRELIEEVRATPGFTVEVVGQHVKVTGPLGTTTLRAGSSGSGKDDRDWRKALKRYAGYPPTAMQGALNEALAATASDPAPTFQPKTPPPTLINALAGGRPRLVAAQAEQPPQRPPATAAVNTSPTRFKPSGPITWTQAVYCYLKKVAPSALSVDELIDECPPKEHNLAVSSVSPIISARWLDAQPGDVFLHIHRRRVTRGHVYWYDANERRPERRDDTKLGKEPEPKPVVPEPAPEPPMVIPVEPDRPTVPEPERKYPDVFERIGDIGDRLLLLDERGGTWLAQPTKMQRVTAGRVIHDERGNVWITEVES